jgi:hypothetical protein
MAHLGGQDQGAQHLEMTSECAAAVAKSVGEDREFCMQLQQLKKAPAAAQTDPSWHGSPPASGCHLPQIEHNTTRLGAMQGRPQNAFQDSAAVAGNISLGWRVV